MSDYSSNYNSALQKARQVASKFQLAGQGNSKRSLDDNDDEPQSKRFSGSAMPHQQLQQAQQAAQALASKLGQSAGGGYPPQQNKVIPNPEALQKAKELINKFQMSGQISGGGGGNGGGNGSGVGQPNTSPLGRPGLGSTVQEEIMVPGNKVGLIIGKGGETIKQLQEKTGAKMVVVQDGPGQEMEKPLKISGDPQKVEHAKQLVFDLIGGGDQNPNGRGGGGGGGGSGGGGGGGGGFNNRSMQPRQQDHGNPNYGYGNGGGPHNEQIELFVPKIAVGVVIGKGGDMIKKIQAETGCKLQFIQQSKNEEQGDRRCVVSGSKQQVEDGKRMIEDLITSVLKKNSGNYQNDGGWNSNYNQQSSQPIAGGVQVQQEQYQFIVPASKCGIIIGRNGDTIKQINQQSGAHCEMDRKASGNQTTEKTFTIRGEQHQVDEAKRLIQDKINMDISLSHLGTQTVTQAPNSYGAGQNAQSQNWYGAGAAYGAQSWDQSQAPCGVQGQAGSPDYSMQWISYYRSMGMHREADAIEAQVKQRPADPSAAAQGAPSAPQAAAPAAPGGGGSSQQDYSAEWASYYRSIGKNDEADAIEKQIANRPAQGATPTSGGYGGQNMAAYQQQYQQPQFQGQGYQGQQYQQYGAYPGQQPPTPQNDKKWTGNE